MTEESTAAKDTTTKKTRTRSPNYPALNLADAVERVETVFNELGRSRVGDEDVAKALGYNKLHGKSRTVVSALKKYGLLEPDGDGFRISDDALDIVTLESDAPDRAKAMYDAALKPTLFAELHETYGDKPPGDSLLRNYLLKKNFNHNVADEVIRLYRDTMDLVSRKIEDYNAADELDGERQEAQMQQQTTNRQVPASTGSRPASPDSGSSQQAATTPTTFLLQFRPTENSEARIELMGDITQEAIETIRQVLNTIKGGPAKDQQPVQGEVEPSTEQPVIEMPAPE